MLNISLRTFITFTSLLFINACSSFKYDLPCGNNEKTFFTTCAKTDDEIKLVVAGKDQRMALLRGNKLQNVYDVSTAKKGFGETLNSDTTPRGIHVIAEKLGSGAQPGAVFEDRLLTGETVEVDTPGRWPVVTRILWLSGLEKHNENTRERYVYIHGSPVEKLLGTPASGGCIRMRSSEILQLFDEVSVGTRVYIFDENLDDALSLLTVAESKLRKLKSDASAGNAEAIDQLCNDFTNGTNGVPKFGSEADRWCSRGLSR